MLTNHNKLYIIIFNYKNLRKEGGAKWW